MSGDRVEENWDDFFGESLKLSLSAWVDRRHEAANAMLETQPLVLRTTEIGPEIRGEWSVILRSIWVQSSNKLSSSL